MGKGIGAEKGYIKNDKLHRGMIVETVSDCAQTRAGKMVTHMEINRFDGMPVRMRWPRKSYADLFVKLTLHQ